MRKTFYIITCLLITQFCHAQFNKYLMSSDAPFNYIDTKWADSTLQQMTINERIGQLFMVATYATNDKRNNKVQIENLIQNYHIGGLIFMQGTPERQVHLLNQYQAMSKTPLLIGMDLENGLGFRLKNTETFPKNMTLGAISDENLVYETAREIARQCKRVGVNVNFAPVLDINNNKDNPVIGTRSFGEDRENVVSKGVEFMRGLQDENVLAVGKHFPGHGDTQTDSHKTLPSLPFSFTRLDSLELYPFRMLSYYGIGGMMTAHLQVPEIDKKHPTSLSPEAITHVLREQLSFNGLIFTDALNMGGVANSNAPGDVDLLALLAGNDILLFPQNVPKAIKKIKQALKKGQLTQEEIDTHVRRILLAKKWCGLQTWQSIPESNLNLDLHPIQNRILQEKLSEASITLVKNEDGLLPLKKLEKRKIAAVSIDEYGDTSSNMFLQVLEDYTEIQKFSLPKGASQSMYNSVLAKLKNYNTIIVSKHHNSYRSKYNFGATQASINFLSQLSPEKEVIFAYFGSPYGLENYDLSNCNSLLVAYEDSDYFRRATAEAIFGGIATTGKLPFGINSQYPVGTGIETEKVRLGYALPEMEKINRDSLVLVDSIINDAIQKGAMPSAQFLLVKNGNIVYKKAYGFHTYAMKKKAQTSDIYDLASVTKVSATLPLIMQECDKGKLTLSTKLAEMLPFFEGTDKAKLTLEDLLTHESGLPSWIPLYRMFIDSTSYGKKLISYKRNATYSLQIDKRAWLNRNFKYEKGLFSKKGGIPVGKNLYLTRSLRDSLFSLIADSELNNKGKYRYSDLGLILCGEYLKEQSDLEERLQTFYKKLGAKTTGMNLWKKYPKSRFVPTARENFLRKQLLQGYVHDPNSALLGGVAGHAGLFSNAEDLAKIWQMYLQKGNYGGEQIIQPSTIEHFSQQVHPKISRRGIGFDKPEADTTIMTSFSKILPLSTFGHTGFTGTMVWADPKNQIIGIILANRIYPHDWNNKMGEMDIRTKIQEAVYNSLRKEQTPISPLLIEPKDVILQTNQ